MGKFRTLSAAEQLAGHLKEELARGTWTGVMPGEEQLLAQLGVGQGTVRGALRLLEDEGILVSEGQGRRRQIVMQEIPASPCLRINILLYEPDDSQSYYMLDLRHRLLEAGHLAEFASKNLGELRMDTERIGRFVARNPADAWVVLSGSREVLEWFAEKRVPVFALAGRRRGIPIASTGPDKLPALRHAVRRLVALGHHRIVMLAREVRRKPVPGQFEQALLDELAAHGILNGPYNLPDWEESVEGLSQVLDSLFRHTPPTALVIEEANTFLAVQQLLAQRGILAPRDVSLVCDDPSPAFAWCRPSAAHINWNGSQWARRIVRWAENIARGRDDRRMTFTKAEFVEGGTMGPAPKGR